MIGLATRLDPLPTTFDHPSRILRRIIFAVNSNFGKTLRFFALVSSGPEVSVRLLSAHRNASLTLNRFCKTPE